MRWHYEPDGEYVVVQSDHGILRCRVFGDTGLLELAVKTMQDTLRIRKARADYAAKH